MDMDLVLHEGPSPDASQACAKCFQGPPEVTMVFPGKCFPCHGTHCLCFGELTWPVAGLDQLCFIVLLDSCATSYTTPSKGYALSYPTFRVGLCRMHCS